MIPPRFSGENPREIDDDVGAEQDQEGVGHDRDHSGRKCVLV